MKREDANGLHTKNSDIEDSASYNSYQVISQAFLRVVLNLSFALIIEIHATVWHETAGLFAPIR